MLALVAGLLLLGARHSRSRPLDLDQQIGKVGCGGDLWVMSPFLRGHQGSLRAPQALVIAVFPQ
jgi:hypothetical protein